MNNNLKQQAQKICDSLGLRPSKKMSQNFLLNEDVLEKIIANVNLATKETVLEIGPGIGFLTERLLTITDKLIAIEIDKRLISFLRDKFLDKKNFKVIQADILELQTLFFSANNNIEDVSGYNFFLNEYVIVSNLPYQITSPILWKFLKQEKHRPKRMVLMMQKEVGERILAKPKKMSLLSVLCQFFANLQKIEVVPKKDFWPQPQVDSMIVGFDLKDNLPNLDIDLFFRFVKMGFSAKRKMLKNNLGAGLQMSSGEVGVYLKQIGLNEKVRAQDLSVEDWVKIYGVLNP